MNESRRPPTVQGPHAPLRDELGMSLIEVLIAVAIMTVIALGIVPLFMRSIRQNREGANYTEVTNIARSALEELVRNDFNSPELTIDAGTVKETRQVYDRTLQLWVNASLAPNPLPDPTDWTKPHFFERRIKVEQFAGGDFIEDGYLDTPEPAGTNPTEVQIKRIRVMVLPVFGSTPGVGQFLLGSPNPTTLEAIKGI